MQVKARLRPDGVELFTWRSLLRQLADGLDVHVLVFRQIARQRRPVHNRNNAGGVLSTPTYGPDLRPICGHEQCHLHLNLTFVDFTVADPGTRARL
jgi:hypothetical protein